MCEGRAATELEERYILLCSTAKVNELHTALLADNNVGRANVKMEPTLYLKLPFTSSVLQVYSKHTRMKQC
jgi:hypothetical protein